MTLPKIPNHIDQGLSKLTSGYARKPRYAAWCASHLGQVQDLEDARDEHAAAFDVDTCDLPRLRLLGKIVGQTEVGTLEQFRLYVKTRILVNRSDGKAPRMIKIARILVGDISYREGGAHISVTAIEPIGDRDPNISAALLREAKSGGVGFDLVFSEVPRVARFKFASGTSSISNGQGFASNSGGDGGTFSRIR